MAYEFGTKRGRQRDRERQQLANMRVRGLRGDNHPYRWCPTERVTILVGPDYLCPACGKRTSLGS